METDSEEDTWEDLEEAVEEYGEEEGEYIPPGYQAAGGLFKSYCTCENFVTCQFCSWFYKIKECKRHGQATRRPFKSCTCPGSARDEEEKPQSYEELQQSLMSLKGPPSKHVRTCVCEPELVQPLHCDCMKFLEKKHNKKSDLAKDAQRPLEDFEEENDELEVGMLEGYEEAEEENEEWVAVEHSGETEKQDKPDVRQSGIAKPEGSYIKRTCTCEKHHPPRSGSSTELETDSEVSTSFSSVEVFHVGEGFPDDGDNSSELTASEASSAAAAPFDPTQIRWYNNASDRSVDSITEDELDESEVDRIAAHWGIRHIYSRSSTSKPKEEPREDSSKAGQTRQYLVVQHNRTEVPRYTCKKKKDKAKPYYYKLMELKTMAINNNY